MTFDLHNHDHPLYDLIKPLMGRWVRLIVMAADEDDEPEPVDVGVLKDFVINEHGYIIRMEYNELDRLHFFKEDITIEEVDPSKLNNPEDFEDDDDDEEQEEREESSSTYVF